MELIQKFTNEKIESFKQLIGNNYNDLDFVWHGFPLGTVGSLVAAGGVGKSFLALQKCLSVAIGRDDCKKGAVLYLPAEDPIEEIGKRLQTITKELRLSDEEILQADKNFHVWSLLGRSPDLMEEKEEDFIFKKNIDQALKTLKNVDPFRLIVFDTLRRFHYSDENNGGDMAKVLSIMEQICLKHKVSCLFLHHTSKAASLGGQADSQQASRGSSVLVDNIRYQEYLAPMTKEEVEKLSYYNEVTKEMTQLTEDDRSYFVRWGISKQNYGSPVPEQWLMRFNGVLKPCKVEKTDKKESKDNGKKESDRKRDRYEK